MVHPTINNALAVIIPVHNRPKEVLSAVRSVVEHGPVGVRIIVVDDGSSPPLTMDTSSHAGLELIRIENSGPGAARTAGVAATDTEFVAFLDSDDQLLPGWGRAVAAAIAQDAVLWSCRALYRFANGDPGGASPEPMWQADGAPAALFLAGCFVVRRDLFTAVGGYRTDLRYGENTELGFRISEVVRHRSLPVRVADAQLVLVRAEHNPYDPQAKLEAARPLLAAPPVILRENRSLYGSYLAIAGVAASRLGHRREALSYLARAVRADPLELRHAARWCRAFVARGSAASTGPRADVN